MVKALYKEGFRRIGYVGGDLDILTANERYAGYLADTQGNSGLDHEDEFTYIEGKMAIKDGNIAMERFLSQDDHPKAYLGCKRSASPRSDLLHDRTYT